MRLVRGKVQIIPWVLFLVAALLTAFGTFTPAAVTILAPIGMNFAYRYELNPLVVGMMVISGGHAGAFSPLSVSGALVLGLVDKTDVQVSAVALFSAGFLINLVLSVLTYVLLAKRPAPLVEGAAEAAADEDLAVSGRPDWRQWLTLASLVALVVGALGFHLEIGFLALAAGTLLALVDMKRQEKAVDGVSWSTLLLVAGMMTYITMLEKAGVVEKISEHAAHLGAPLVVALLLCFTVALTSAFASSTAILTAIIPIAVPLLLSSHLSGAGLIAALAVSTTSVGTTPEGRAVVPRASSGVLGEESSEGSGVLVPDRGGDAGDGSVRGLEEVAGATDARRLQVLERTLAGRVREAPQQSPSADPECVRQRGEVVSGGEVLVEVPHDLAGELVSGLRKESRIDVRGLGRPRMVDERHPRGRPCHVGTAVSADEVQCEVVHGAEGRRRRHPLVGDDQMFGSDIGLRTASSQFVGEEPCRRSPASVEKPCLGEQERADADRDDGMTRSGVGADRRDFRGEGYELRVHVEARHELEPRHDKNVDLAQRRDGQRRTT